MTNLSAHGNRRPTRGRSRTQHRRPSNAAWDSAQGGGNPARDGDFCRKVPEFLAIATMTIVTISTINSFTNKPPNYPLFSTDRSPTASCATARCPLAHGCHARHRETPLTQLRSRPQPRAPTVTLEDGWALGGYRSLADHSGDWSGMVHDDSEAILTS
jgi:hypothetical protein